MSKVRFHIKELYSIKQRPLILDGALGSLLQNRDHEVHDDLWVSLLNMTKPEVVIGVHKSYIDAGADIITTNTFRTNPYAVEKANITTSQEEFVRRSVELAFEAREDKDIIIAGSNPPAEDCYQSERTISFDKLESNHKTHIDQLWEFGCDLVLNETQSHLDEIEIICKHCSASEIPYIISFHFTDDKKLLSGEDLDEAVNLVLEYNPMAIGFNCVTPSSFDNVVINDNLAVKWGFYLNCGAGHYQDSAIECGITPSSYIGEVKKWIDHSPLFIGSCCGSSPHHTLELRKYLDGINRN